MLNILNVKTYSPFLSIIHTLDSTMLKTGVVNTTNEILTVLALGKCYFLVRTMMYFTRFSDPRA